MRRVVITGMGVICSAGIGYKEVFEKLCRREMNIVPFDAGGRSGIKTRYIAPCPEIENDEYNLILEKNKFRGSVTAKNAVMAALMAMRDAGIEKADDDTNVIIGTGVPYVSDIGEDAIRAESGKRVRPMAIPLSMTNSSASWISIVLGVHGRSFTVNTACASGTDAIGIAYENVRNGVCNMAVCGGSDNLCEKNMMLVQGFSILKAVTSNEDGIPRPFTEQRNGFLFCEGASAVLILEDLEHALERGAEIYAEITGYTAANDAYSIVSIPEKGEVIEKMMRDFVSGKKVDYYNAHGTGTKLNDAVESRVIQNVFGDKDNAFSASRGKFIL